MGEQNIEQMDDVQLSVDPSTAPVQPPPPSSSEPTTTHNDDKQDQPSSPPTNNELARKLLGVFAVSTTLAIFLWFMAGAGFPWFIYIVYGVSVIDSIIYAVRTKNSFFANWTIFASTNIMLFITYLASGGGFSWWMMPLCSMAILPVSQYICLHYQQPLRGLYIHLAIYLLVNLMLFLIWIAGSLHNSYPWFIYPWCGWGALLLIQYNKVVMHDKSRLFVFICADLGVMLMITFRFAIGPLFMVFLLVGVVLALVYYLFLKKGYAAHCWCMKRRLPDGTPLPTTQQGDVPSNPFAQVPVHPQPPHEGGFALPQFHMQLHPQGYQTVIPPPPPGAMYFSAGQTPYFQAVTAPGAPGAPGPAYYAYFPSNNGLYPTVSNISQTPVPQSPPSAPLPIPSSPLPVPSLPLPVPSSPSPSDAILNSDVNQAKEVDGRDKKGKKKGERDGDGEGEGEEDDRLLRHSNSRSYTKLSSSK